MRQDEKKDEVASIGPILIIQRYCSLFPYTMTMTMTFTMTTTTLS